MDEECRECEEDWGEVLFLFFKVGYIIAFCDRNYLIG